MSGSEIKYRNPPLTEALFDVRVDLNPSFDVNEFEKFFHIVKTDFPTKQQHTKWEAAFHFNKEEGSQFDSKHTENGLLLRSAENEKVVQARLDGFTFNKLRPYNGWEKFTSEAKKLWEIYLDIAKPTRLTRLALRFINLLEIPLSFKDLKEYLLTSPDIAPGMPNAMSEFLLRVVIPEPKTGNVAIIHETVDLSKVRPGIMPLILDIDVYREVDFEPKDKEAIWKVLDSLREYKNCIFENTLTEKAKQLIR